MIKTPLLALSVLAAASTNATAQSAACENMELFTSNTSIEFLGSGAEGAETGDRRILVGRLHDAADNDLGSFRVVSTIIAGTDDGHDLYTATGTYLFPTGRLYITSSGDMPDAADEAYSPGGEWAITGGTGAFANATGTIISRPPQNDPRNLENWTAVIDVECDD